MKEIAGIQAMMTFAYHLKQLVQRKEGTSRHDVRVAGRAASVSVGHCRRLYPCPQGL